MSDEATKVTADNAVPCGTLALIERPLDVLCNILEGVLAPPHSRRSMGTPRGTNLLDRELGHRLLSNVNCFRLHIFRLNSCQLLSTRRPHRCLTISADLIWAVMHGRLAIGCLLRRQACCSTHPLASHVGQESLMTA